MMSKKTMKMIMRKKKLKMIFKMILKINQFKRNKMIRRNRMNLSKRILNSVNFRVQNKKKIVIKRHLTNLQ